MGIGNDVRARAAAWLARAQAAPTALPPPLPLPALQPSLQPSARAENPVDVAAVLCMRFEGFRAKPYLCPAGVATIGFGSTAYADGTRVQLTDPAITRDAAADLLMHTLRTIYVPGALKCCPGVTGTRLAALADFCYNLGVGRLKASTLRKKVNAGDWDGARVELLKWTKGGGRVLKGLILRRGAEATLL